MNINISTYFIWRCKGDKPQHKYELIVDELYRMPNDVVSDEVKKKIIRAFQEAINKLPSGEVVPFLKFHYNHVINEIERNEWLYYTCTLLTNEYPKRFQELKFHVFDEAMEWLSDEAESHPIIFDLNMDVLEECFDFNLELRPNIRDKVQKSKDKLDNHLDPDNLKTEIFTYSEIKESYQNILVGIDLNPIMDDLVYVTKYFTYDPETEEKFTSIYTDRKLELEVTKLLDDENDINSIKLKQKKESLFASIRFKHDVKETNEKTEILSYYNLYQLLCNCGDDYIGKSAIEFQVNSDEEDSKLTNYKIQDQFLSLEILELLSEKYNAKEIYEKYKDYFKVIDQIKLQRESFTRYTAKELGISLFKYLQKMVIEPNSSNNLKIDEKEIRAFIGEFYVQIDIEDRLRTDLHKFNKDYPNATPKEYHTFLAKFVYDKIEGKDKKNKRTPFVIL